MTAGESRPVLIAGGGIGGLTLSIALERAGMACIVLERTSELKEVGAAIALWPNATRILEKLGLLEETLERSAPIRECEIRDRSGRLLKRWRIPILDTPAVFIARSELQSMLAAAMPKGSLRLNRPCGGFEETEDGVKAGGEEGAVLVGADGLHSKIRTQLLGESKPVYQGYTQWRALIPEIPGLLAPGLKREWWGHGVRFGIGSHGKGLMNWYLSANRPEPEGSRKSKEKLLEWTQGWADPIGEILRATPEDVILTTDICARPPSKVWGRGRVTLLGDAAHPTSPNLGQGAGMAIEDTDCLAACLSSEKNPITAFRRYETMRKKRTASVTERSGLVGQMGQWRHPALVSARNAFLKLFPVSLWERRLKSLYDYRSNPA